MSLRDFIMYCAAGFGLQVVLIVTLTWLGGQKITATIYWPWPSLGEYVFPSGPGGHALQAGAILGLYAGVFVYSLAVGALVIGLKRIRSQE